MDSHQLLEFRQRGGSYRWVGILLLIGGCIVMWGGARELAEALAGGRWLAAGPPLALLFVAVSALILGLQLAWYRRVVVFDLTERTVAVRGRWLRGAWERTHRLDEFDRVEVGGRGWWGARLDAPVARMIGPGVVLDLTEPWWFLPAMAGDGANEGYVRALAEGVAAAVGLGMAGDVFAGRGRAEDFKSQIPNLRSEI